MTSLIALGYVIEVNEVDKYVLIHGKGRQIPKKEATIDVGSAGTAARFLTAMLALPMGIYHSGIRTDEKTSNAAAVEALTSMGAEFTFLEKTGTIFRYRLRVRHLAEKKPADKVQVDISESTQF